MSQPTPSDAVPEISGHDRVQVDQLSSLGEQTEPSGEPAGAAPAREPADGQPVTGVGLILSGVLGFVACSVLFALLWFGLPHDAYLFLFFWRDPSIPYATCFVFFWALAILCLKPRLIARQQGAFTHELLPRDPYHLITTRDVQAILREINRMPAKIQNLLLIKRIWRALKRVRASGNSGEIANFLEYQANLDFAAMDSTYSPVKIFIWSIPVLGFIGTVWGISVAIGSFGELVQNAGDVEKIKAGLGPVTGGLAVAFETTLLALVCSMILMFGMTYIRGREEDLLTSIEEFCVVHLLNKLSIGDDKLVSELNEALAEAQQEGLRKQAEVVESALTELQERQQQALERLNKIVDDRHVETIEKFTGALQEMFEAVSGQQANRLAEMSQRFERGIRALTESIEKWQAQEPAASGSPDVRFTADIDPEKANRLIAVLENQVQELGETRRSMQALSSSLDHLATLEPFQQVMTNIQRALDLLVPAIDELRKPRELRILEAHVPGHAPRTDQRGS